MQLLCTGATKYQIQRAKYKVTHQPYTGRPSLRRHWVCYFQACCANFNFYNYEADLFQAVSWMFSIKCHLYGVSLPARSWCLVLIPNKQTATHLWSRFEVERPKTEGKCKRALVMVISIYPCGINTHRKGLIKSLDTMNVYEILAHYKSSDIDFIPDILIPQS